MKTAEKLIRDMGDEIPFSVYEKAKPYMIEAMKAYGRQCAEQALKDAAERVEIIQVDTEYNSKTGERDPVYAVDAESILNTPIVTQ